MTDILCKELRDSGLSVKDNEILFSVDRCIEEMDSTIGPENLCRYVITEED